MIRIWGIYWERAIFWTGGSGQPRSALSLMSSRCLAEEEAAESADVEGIATKQGGKSVKYGS